MANNRVEFPKETPKPMFSEGKHWLWLIGNRGMLGTELSLLLEKAGIPFIGTDREVDITEAAALADFTGAQERPFTWIVNCAAYTAVDRAEDDRENCRLLNAVGAGNIAAAAMAAGATLIHISTDYVFNGRGNRPYTEEDDTDPIGVYGLTKRDGERQVLQENPRSYIIRSAWMYGRYGGNFVHTMLRLMGERESVAVVNDQRGSPTWAHDLAAAILSLICASSVVSPGIYHFTNGGGITWYDFACEIYAQSRALGILTRDCTVTPCSSGEFPAKVQRPAWSVLDTTKITKTLGIAIPGWKESLREYLSSYA